MKDEYDEPEAHGTAPPRNAEEALARARNHARAAAAEAVAALHALLDAAALAGIGRPADTHRLLGPAAQILSQLARELGSGRISRVESLLVSVTRAVDDEITRWEQRARDDAEARAVLRAFLGLRELLWEMGVRDPTEVAQSRRAQPASPPRRPAPSMQGAPAKG